MRRRKRRPRCWGYNGLGQLGNNSTNSSPVPVPVSGLTSGVTAVAAGYWHTCAVVSGSARCWGGNDDAQLGTGTRSQSLTPTPVSGLSSGVTAIAARSMHTCAVVNGGAQCWGQNSFGESGNGKTMGSLTPVDVTGLQSSATLGTAVLQSPAAGATGQLVQPTFSWNNASGATAHILEVSTTSGFTAFKLRKTITSGTSYPVSAGEALDAGTTYYWRILATDGTSTTDSGTRSFTTTGGNTQVGAATPASPVGGTTVSTTPTFTWSAGTGAIWCVPDQREPVEQLLVHRVHQRQCHGYLLHAPE